MGFVISVILVLFYSVFLTLIPFLLIDFVWYIISGENDFLLIGLFIPKEWHNFIKNIFKNDNKE